MHPLLNHSSNSFFLYLSLSLSISKCSFTSLTIFLFSLFIVIGQIRLVIGQSNLFINERFKQFNGLIDDCDFKRGEKETKVEDLAGFWDMIYYQVKDLKLKYDQLELLEHNNWLPINGDVVDNIETKTQNKGSSLKIVVDNKSNIINKNPSNKRAVSNMKTSPPSINKNGDSENGQAIKKTAVRSNIREFLKNKRKELTNGNENNKNGIEQTQTNGCGSTNALTNGTNLHLNGLHNKTLTNGHHTHNGDHLIESQKLKLLTETMSRHCSLTSSATTTTTTSACGQPVGVDETNKEN